MNKVVLFILIAVFPSICSAGTASGKILTVLAHSGGGNGSGVFMFSMDGNRDSPPSCSTVGGGKEWAMSLENEFGRAMYALVLSASAQNKNIYVHGSGDCRSWGDREHPTYINMTK